MAAPCSGGVDSGGRFVRRGIESEGGSASVADAGPEGERETEQWSGVRQAEWAKAVLPLLLTKQSVAGITWAQLDDSGPSGFPSAGLIDENGSSRPVVEAIREQRYGHWPAD